MAEQLWSSGGVSLEVGDQVAITIPDKASSIAFRSVRLTASPGTPLPGPDNEASEGKADPEGMSKAKHQDPKLAFANFAGQ